MSDYKKVADLTPEQRAHRLNLTTLSQIRWAMKKKGLNPDDPPVLRDYVRNHCQRKTYDRLFDLNQQIPTPTGKHARTEVRETGLANPYSQNTGPLAIICTVNLGMDSISFDKIRNEITARIGTLDVHVQVDDKELAEISAKIKKQLQDALHCEDVSPFEALWLIADLCKRNCEAVEALLEEVKKRG